MGCSLEVRLIWIWVSASFLKRLICLPVRQSVRRTFLCFICQCPHKLGRMGKKKEKGIGPVLINRDDKIGCLCANANSLERLFTLPESRCFDYPTPHHLFRRPTFLFLYCTTSIHPPPPTFPANGMSGCSRPHGRWRGNWRIIADAAQRLPAAKSKTKPHYHKELSLLVGRVLTFFLICLNHPTPLHKHTFSPYPSTPTFQYHCCYRSMTDYPTILRRSGFYPWMIQRCSERKKKHCTKKPGLQCQLALSLNSLLLQWRCGHVTNEALGDREVKKTESLL